MRMGNELKASCGERAEFLVLPARSHNEPFYRPQMEYWGPVVEWVERQGTKGLGTRDLGTRDLGLGDELTR
jgi:hypothetical protein